MSLPDNVTEEAALLRHYQMDDLNADLWVDVTFDRATARQSVLQRSVSDNKQFLEEGVGEDDNIDLSDTTDPLGIKSSIFLENGQISHLDLKQRSTIIANNKGFNPRLFLTTVHRDTSYADLITGIERLKLTVDQRSDALKTLVHGNFDRFVGAKNMIDHVYEEMKKKKLNSEEEYGVRGLSGALQEATRRAKQVFGPVIERREKTEKLRSTLGVLEQYKFFFNLPSSLLESVKQNKYEIAIRDYKKGKYLYQTTLSSTRVTDDSGLERPNMELKDVERDGGDITDLHRKVFDKVWIEVEKIVVEFREMLLKQLEEPWRSMEEQERNINYLFDLDTKEDPVWHYLDSQYRFIIGLLNDTFDEGISKIKALEQPTLDPKESERQRAIALKNAIVFIGTKDIETGLLKETETQVWRATLQMIKSLNDLLLRCLPDFWKLAKNFVEGKFSQKQAPQQQSNRRRRGVDLAKVEQCQQMVKEIVNLYAALISKHFSLSTPLVPVANASEAGEGEHPPLELPPFLPKNANCVTTSFFLTRIVTEIANCVNDINSINLAGEAFSGLGGLMEEVRWRFCEVLCECWARDSKTFYMLEDWTPDRENPETTAFLKSFHLCHKYCARSAYKISSLSAVSDESNEKLKVPPDYLDKIRGTFLDSLYSFLDGLVHLAFSDYMPLEPQKSSSSAFKKDHFGSRRARIDVHMMDSRILLTLCNLAQLRSTIIPKLVRLFESAYDCAMEEELKTLTDVVDQLDGILFKDYIERKQQILSDVVRNGILDNGVDWYNITKPTNLGSHSFVYEALLSLVMVHAQVSDVAKPLLHRALSNLLESMAQDCLECFQQIDRFGMGGMLQATLEIEFMHQTLSQYINPASGETLRQIYAVIEQAYDPQQQTGNLQEELSIVKKLLVESRKSTMVQFLCFKQMKNPTSNVETNKSIGREGVDSARSKGHMREDETTEDRGRERGREWERVTRDTKDARDARDTKDARDVRDMRDIRDVRDIRDARDARDARDGRDARDLRDTRDARDARDARAARDGRDGDVRDLREGRGLREGKDSRDVGDQRQGRDPRQGRDGRDYGDTRSIPNRRNDYVDRNNRI